MYHPLNPFDEWISFSNKITNVFRDENNPTEMEANYQETREQEMFWLKLY